MQYSVDFTIIAANNYWPEIGTITNKVSQQCMCFFFKKFDHNGSRGDIGSCGSTGVQLQFLITAK